MDAPFNIPSIVQNNIVTLYRDGKTWLDNLSTFISYYEKQWQFKAGACFSDAQYNIVLNAFKNDNTNVVFKCCVPNKEFKTEINALIHFNGLGVVKLLQCDIENGAMLIEKINPGTLLESLVSIEDATSHAFTACKKLHKPIHHDADFPNLRIWFDGLNRIIKPFCDTSLIQQAKSVSDHLLRSQTKVVLLHGDLHYANLLLADNGDYIAIDPKGIIGEPEYEIPLPRVNHSLSQKELLYRLDCYIDVSGFDRERIYGWLFSKAVLAACWTVEDSGAVNHFTHQFLTVANTIQYYL